MYWKLKGVITIYNNHSHHHQVNNTTLKDMELISHITQFKPSFNNLDTFTVSKYLIQRFTKTN